MGSIIADLLNSGSANSIDVALTDSDSDYIRNHPHGPVSPPVPSGFLTLIHILDGPDR
jgi:hypothetical protein